MSSKMMGEAFEEAARLIERWHYKKGGYGNLAEAIRALAKKGGGE